MSDRTARRIGARSIPMLSRAAAGRESPSRSRESRPRRAFRPRNDSREGRWPPEDRHSRIDGLQVSAARATDRSPPAPHLVIAVVELPLPRDERATAGQQRQPRGPENKGTGSKAHARAVTVSYRVAMELVVAPTARHVRPGPSRCGCPAPRRIHGGRWLSSRRSRRGSSGSRGGPARVAGPARRPPSRGRSLRCGASLVKDRQSHAHPSGAGAPPRRQRVTRVRLSR